MSSSRPVTSESAPAIEVSGVEKRFYRFGNRIAGAARRLFGLKPREGTYEVFRAVDGVSFNIQRGEVVGIIGANGSGKTTLLKMIAGLLPVDAGSIKVRGSLQALLALGVGVNPDFTGRENIYYGGLLLGMSKRELAERTPGIIEFAELGGFIDQPFRTYSSGMRARLLFSISMSIAPDILIVDEALAMGDAAFVQKSFGRVNELLSSGVTMLFVSHNLNQIRQICTRCLVLERGRLVYDGDTDGAIQRYVSGHVRQVEQRLRTQASGKGPVLTAGIGGIEVESAGFFVADEPVVQLTIGEPCQFHIEINITRELPPFAYCVELRSEKSAAIFAYLPPTPEFFDDGLGERTLALGPGRHKLIFDIPALIVGDGSYSADIEFFPDEREHQFTYEMCYCYYRRAVVFSTVYRDSHWFGRGVLSELPVSRLQVVAQGA